MRAVVLAVMWTSVSVQAQPVTIMGSGAKVSCGVWLEARRDLRDRVGNTYGLQGWALGYMSGAASYGSVGDILGNTDLNGVSYWLDNYCNSHPAVPFSDGVRAFIEERRAALPR